MKPMKSLTFCLPTILFISHMVQMKQIKFACLMYVTKKFISHMVQMKPTCSQNFLVVIVVFISHMVQMKLCWQRICEDICLYLYPTWFRWNIYHKQKKMSRGKDLYPTWFRWNQVWEYPADTFTTPFISHMVQMKRGVWVNKYSVKIYLYPTWFRWNSFMYYTKHFVNCIYIPHGSDETPLGISSVNLLNKFISHMVQMKRYAMYLLNFYPPHLYPTWFRWNNWI